MDRRMCRGGHESAVRGATQRSRVAEPWRRLLAPLCLVLMATAIVRPAQSTYQQIKSFDELQEAVRNAGEKPTVCAFVAPWCAHSKFTTEHMLEANKVLEQLRRELLRLSTDTVDFVAAQFLEADATAIPKLRDRFVTDRFPVVDMISASDDGLHETAVYNGERVTSSIVNWVLQQSAPIVKAATSWDLVDKITKFGSSVFVLTSVEEAPSQPIGRALKHAFEQFASAQRNAGVFVYLVLPDADASPSGSPSPAATATVHAVHPGFGSTTSIDISLLLPDGASNRETKSIAASRTRLLERFLETHLLPYITGLGADNFDLYGFSRSEHLTRSLPGSLQNPNISALVRFIGTDLHFERFRQGLELSAQQLWATAKFLWLDSNRYDGHIIGSLGLSGHQIPSLMIEVLLERVGGYKSDPSNDGKAPDPQVYPTFSTFMITDKSVDNHISVNNEGSLAALVSDPIRLTRTIQDLLRDVTAGTAVPYRRSAVARTDLFETNANNLENELTGEIPTSSSSSLSSKPDYLLLVFRGNSNPVADNLETELKKLAASFMDEEVQEVRDFNVGLLTIDVRINDVTSVVRRFKITSFPAAVAIKVGKTPQKFLRFSGTWSASSLRAFLMRSVEQLDSSP